jgi:tRNA-dihydrouridine synthase C
VVRLPLVANGEIWSVADAQRCQQVSGCESLMLGRGMVANPALARAIRGVAQGRAVALSWAELLPMIAAFFLLVQLHLERRQQTGRLKQWLNLLRRTYPQAQAAFLAIRGFHDPADVSTWLHAEQQKLQNLDGSLESA